MNVRFMRIFLALAIMFSMLGINVTSTVSAPSQLPVPQTEGDEGFVISSKDAIVPQARAKNRDWTEKEMMDAQPFPLDLADGGKPAILSNQDLQPSGAPVFIEGTLPAGVRSDTSVVPPLTLESLGPQEPLGYTYPAPFSRYYNFNKYKTYPYVTVGKLFFTQYGVDYVCSAASIGNDAIWTAGHCVHAGNGSSSGWSYNVVFAPAYENGKAKLGQWKYYSLYTRSEWYYSSDHRFDIAGAILYKSKVQGKKTSITKKVGSLGFAYNMGVDRHWHAMGYPAGYPFDGNSQQICAASYAYSDTAFGSPYPTGIGCDQTGGSSGGPWILSFGGPGYSNYLNGNNSYRYTSHPLEMYSPYFGDAAYSLYYTLIHAALP